MRLSLNVQKSVLVFRTLVVLVPICWLAGEKKKTHVRWAVIFLNSETRNDDSEPRC